MWTIRFLSGPLVGKSFELKEHLLFGRDSACDVIITEQGVSKQHAEITVTDGEVIIRDLGSSNGTFVNGYKIKNQKLKLGDKVSFYQVVAEVGIGQASILLPVLGAVDSAAEKGLSIRAEGNPTPSNTPGGQWAAPSLAQNGEGRPIEGGEPKPKRKIESPDQLVDSATAFINEKVMPNVYQMTEHLSFRTLFLGVMAVFLIAVTVLSVIPLYMVTSESVQNEAFLRAVSVARGVANINESRFRDGEMQRFTTDMTFKERGIEDVYVIGRDGVVLAPLEQSGAAPKHVSFARKVRGQPREFVESVGTSVLAAVPIIIFDPDQQQNVAKAHVVVSYSPEVLSFNDARLFSLFIQVLVIGLIVGGLLFYILYKLIEYAFRSIYRGLDEAIRAGADQVVVNFNFPIVQDLVTIMNSLLARVQNSDPSPLSTVSNRSVELKNILDLMPYPSLMVRKDRSIVHVNSAFCQMLNVQSDQLSQKSIFEIPDQAMQQNLNFLMDQSFLNTSQVVTDSLDISGHQFLISCQAITLEADEVDAFVLSISPHEEASAG